MKTTPYLPTIDTQIPKSLQTREGWSMLFDKKRRDEPHLHQIEPTNECIYECIMCPRKKMTRAVGHISTDLFEAVIDEVAGYDQSVKQEEIELFHFGESLLYPQLPQLIKYVADKQLKPVLSLNAPLLTEAISRQILQSNPYKVIFSLDGADNKTYQFARGNGVDVNLARRNIDTFIHISQQLNSSCVIILRMILLNKNLREAEQFELEWQQKGVQVQLREFFPWGDKEMQHLAPFRKYPPGMPCPYPWQHLVVQYNGDVVPCCRDYNGTLKLGNVKEQSLKEIWNSEKYAIFREQHKTGHYGSNKTCEECMSLYYTCP